MNRRADIQGIRALAIVMVVAFHAGLPVPGGFSGVDVFFVVSGFVIGRLLLSELERTGGVKIARFFAGRVRRLFPALTVMLGITVLLVAGLAAGARLEGTAESAFAALAMVANMYFYRNTTDYFGVLDGELPLLHTWTLSVEEQFYLFVPLGLLAVWWMARRLNASPRVVLTVATLLVAAASLGLAEVLSGGRPLPLVTDPVIFAFYSSPTRAWEFLAGTLVALAGLPLLRPQRRWPGTLAALVGFACVIAAAFLAGKAGPVPGRGVLLPVAGTALLIAGTTVVPNGVITRGLSRSAVTWFGDISYSWYLWHWPLIVLGSIAVPERDLALALAIASLIPAWLSYRFVETPIRTSRRVRGRRTLALAGACAATLALCTIAAFAWSSSLTDRIGISNLTAALTEPALAEGGQCVDGAGQPWYSGASSGFGRCLPGLPHSAPRILLVGDSHAQHYGYGLLDVARRRGMRLDVATLGGCFAAPLRSASGTRVVLNRACRETQDEIARQLRSDTPDLLVIGQTDYLNRKIVDPPGGAAGEAEHSDRALARRYRAALLELVRPVLEHDGRVLILLTIPRMRTDPAFCASFLRILLGDARTCFGTSRAEYERSHSPLRDGAVEVAAQSPPIHVFDPAPFLCDARWCSPLRNGVLAYRNRDHLSVDGSRGLARGLDAAAGAALTTPRRPPVVAVCDPPSDRGAPVRGIDCG